MHTALVVIFLLAYAAIAFEHPIKINKSAIASLAGALLWTVYALGSDDRAQVLQNLNHSLGDTAQIILFLMGAMTIVELIDTHNGFEVLTSRMKTTRTDSLLRQIGLTTFFLSAALDNLTTTIIMVSLVKKLLSNEEERLLFAGLIVIAANAGGAWSPIGDVTTTMLWIGGQVTSSSIMCKLFLPSLISLIIPLLLVSWMLRGHRVSFVQIPEEEEDLFAQWRRSSSRFAQRLMFFSGMAALVSVPVFKCLTHLPPCIGVLFSLSLVWIVNALFHRRDANQEYRFYTSGKSALRRIDMAAVLFFAGILLAVATLAHTQLLANLAAWMHQVIGRESFIILLTGIASAVVDNVPLVAASMSMYSLTDYPVDHLLWEFLAYCAGTGGSMLVIGSAAGVAASGLLQINFFWYARKIGTLAACGYFAGAGAYMVQGLLWQ